jgi:NAD(P)-dependent dehydrogenase (short-subunit alcohol dehydrogenase family)
MTVDLQDWRVVVTGGAVRIGRAICLAFARAGARIIVHCNRSVEAARELLAMLEGGPDRHLIVRGDLTGAEFRRSLIHELCCRNHVPHCLVNNASTYRRMPLLETDETEFRKDFEVNFVAPLMLMREFAIHCGEGCIINLLDQRVNQVEAGVGPYGMAKRALRDATEMAALEWAPSIRVNAVAPGYTLPPPGVSAEAMEPLLQNIPSGCSSSPEEIAQACLFLARSPSVTGQTVYVDGGMHLTAPRRTERAT